MQQIGKFVVSNGVRKFLTTRVRFALGNESVINIKLCYLLAIK
jgi:hypothetical protein